MPWILHLSFCAQSMGTLVRCSASPVTLDLINIWRYRTGLPKLAAWTWTEIQVAEIVVCAAIIRSRRLSATYSAGEEILNIVKDILPHWQFHIDHQAQQLVRFAYLWIHCLCAGHTT